MTVSARHRLPRRASLHASSRFCTIRHSTLFTHTMHPTHDHPPIRPIRRTRRRVRHGADGVSRHRCARARDATSPHRDSRATATFPRRDARPRTLERARSANLKTTTTIDETRATATRARIRSPHRLTARDFSLATQRATCTSTRRRSRDWRSVYSEGARGSGITCSIVRRRRSITGIWRNRKSDDVMDGDVT